MTDPSTDQRTTEPLPLNKNEVLLLNPNAKPSDITDVIDEQLSQLKAMLAITYGETPSPLGALSEQHQDNYSWAMYRHVQMIERLVKLLPVSPIGRKEA